MTSEEKKTGDPFSVATLGRGTNKKIQEPLPPPVHLWNTDNEVCI